MDDEFEPDDAPDLIEPPAKRGRKPGRQYTQESKPAAPIAHPLERFAIVLGIRVEVPEGYERIMGDERLRTGDKVLDCSQLPEVVWNIAVEQDFPCEAADFQMVVRRCPSN